MDLKIKIETIKYRNNGTKIKRCLFQICHCEF